MKTYAGGTTKEKTRFKNRRRFLLQASSSLLGATITASATSSLLPDVSIFTARGALAANNGPDLPDPNSPELKIALDQVEAYLASLTTVDGRFIQANPDGSYLEGSMYIHRPGRMRFEYDEPVPFLLVADGTFFIHVDKQLKNTTHIPLGATPANFLLSDELTIRDGLTVSGYERVNGLLRLSLFQTDDPDLGKILLTFTEDPFTLKQWTIVDSQFNQTTVTLISPRFGADLDPALFKFKDPWRNKRDK